MRTSVRVGDTVTIQDYKCDGEYTVLALNTDPSSGWPDGFAWLHGPSGYATQAVSYLKRKPEYTVEFYNKEYPIGSDRAPYYAKTFSSMDKVAEYLRKITIGTSERVVIRKE